ncbi:hypothetical protein CFOL_v3_10918 [Cephalotus follicularis]|uniref:Uncharacterized protein n=1 Tax=Cephalotus follicularis TaxID=3775 RepID=A0A1Q3BHU1_CEPFO|nr:hypothetical protein CFOL_v3_10918 [Cephalotus follicularis]
MVVSHIVPRSGSYDHVSQMELYIMWHVVSGTMLNLPLLILQHMKETLNKDIEKLPYGGLLSRVFKLFHVPLDAEAQEYLKRMNFIDGHTIAHIHWEKKNNMWVKTGQGEEREVEPKDEAMEAPPIQSYTSIENILDYLREMEGWMNVNSIDAKIDAQYQAHMKAISELKTQFQAGFSMADDDSDDDDAGLDDGSDVYFLLVPFLNYHGLNL